MKISIITINLNNAFGLRRTINSIATQVAHLAPGGEIEHIIVDGESHDGSLDRLPRDLKSIVLSAPAKGVYNAINVGLDVVTGDIVGLLHSGDVYASPDALSIIAGRFMAPDNVDFIWSDVTVGKRFYSGKDFTPGSLLSGFAPPHPSLYMRRSVFEKAGKYDESFKVAGDFDYFIRLFHDPYIRGIYMPGALVQMEAGGLSQKFVNRVWTNNRERLRALRKNGLPASPWRIVTHYKNVFSGFLCSTKK